MKLRKICIAKPHFNSRNLFNKWFNDIAILKLVKYVKNLLSSKN
jgi:hypothetical protein